MIFIVYSVIIGAIVACSMKLASPHRNPISWMVASLVGGLGGIVGLFSGRMIGVSGLRSIWLLICAAIASAGLTLLYAVLSRMVHRSNQKTGRKTRHTLIF